MTPAPQRFTVQLVGVAPVQVQRLVSLAEQRGLQTLLAEVLREMSERLETEPREWGDPYLNYRGLAAVGYGRTMLSTLIRVVYAVHDTEPLVWVSAVRPLAGSPFEST